MSIIVTFILIGTIIDIWPEIQSFFENDNGELITTHASPSEKVPLLGPHVSVQDETTNPLIGKHICNESLCLFRNM